VIYLIFTNTKDIVIYKTQEGDISINVLVENDTVWLTQAQMVTLFDSSKANVSEHIKNIYSTEELEKISTVRQEGNREIVRNIDYYNLDMIIALGYRVNIKRGTQFRIWANRVLKDFIINGYAVNNKLQLEQYEDLKKTLKLLSNVLQNKELTADEATGLLHVITDYTYALDTLDRYDYQQLFLNCDLNMIYLIYMINYKLFKYGK